MPFGFLRRRAAFGAYLAVGFAAIGCYYLLPENSVGQAVFYSVIGVYGIVALLAGACVNLRGAERRPWLLFAGGLVAFALLTKLLQNPRLYRFAAKAGRVLQRPFARDGRISRLPLPFGEWTRTRDLPAVASRTFSERWADLQKESTP